MAKYGKKSQTQVKKAMHEYNRGKLTIGKKGGKVKSPKQAIVIGLSEARKKGGRSSYQKEMKINSSQIPFTSYL